MRRGGVRRGRVLLPARTARLRAGARRGGRGLLLSLALGGVQPVSFGPASWPRSSLMVLTTARGRVSSRAAVRQPGRRAAGTGGRVRDASPAARRRSAVVRPELCAGARRRARPLLATRATPVALAGSARGSRGRGPVYQPGAGPAVLRDFRGRLVRAVRRFRERCRLRRRGSARRGRAGHHLGARRDGARCGRGCSAAAGLAIADSPAPCRGRGGAFAGFWLAYAVWHVFAGYTPLLVLTAAYALFLALAAVARARPARDVAPA